MKTRKWVVVTVRRHVVVRKDDNSKCELRIGYRRFNMVQRGRGHTIRYRNMCVVDRKCEKDE